MPQVPLRHIDHLVIAVRELEQAADVYRRLGFQVGARNRHPWGTENRLIQFGSSFIELITMASSDAPTGADPPRQFSFGAFVRRYLKTREGIAMLVLSSADAQSDAAEFAAQGIGDFEPFFFARKGKRPDGSDTQVAFTLAFARDAEAPGAGYFVCQQHHPENFWDRNFQQHANGTVDISGVTLTAECPNSHSEFLAAFSGGQPQPLPGGGLRFAVEGGGIVVLPATATQWASGLSASLTSCSVRVESIEAVRHLLRAAEMPFCGEEQEIVIPAHLLFGVELRFEDQRGR